ncbi:MAG: NAD-dependent epimerase/dehydratase family protein [Bacteroidetes bacterium]|nr:NAD-dependent epimerase/dehydratase family protein [Bacteroidota bacterium]
MRIFVLGSDGFIGSNVVKYFKQRGHEVYKSDITLKDEENYLALHPERVNFDELISAVKPDVCLNATGAANVQFSFQQPALDYTLNVANVYWMLEALRKAAPECRFLNLSSAAIYGNPVSLPIAETAMINPLSPYGWHKVYSEQVCKEFHTHFSIRSASLRVFSAYGPGLKKQLFWDLYQKLTKPGTKKVEMFGTGAESRDFIYVRDIARAIECVIERASFEGEAINIASGAETTIEEAVHTFRDMAAPGIDLQFNGAEKKGDPKNWRADITTLRSLGFEASVNMKEGLQGYLDWLKSL